MDFDDIGLAAHQETVMEWAEKCRNASEGICELAGRYRKRDDCWLLSLHQGSYNFSFRLHWEDGGEDWLIRFPVPGKSMFLEEKVYNEVALMKYIAANTQVPVPRVIGYGKAEDNPTGLGPFIIMTWVEGKPMSEILRKEKDSEEEDDVLNPDLDSQAMETLYGQMAEILLELWKLDFDLIGSLRLDEATGKSSIEGPPLTQQTNELIRVCSVASCAPRTVYHSSADYIFSLLGQQSTNLEQQRNAVSDAEDGRLKHTCRHLMKSIALNFISLLDNHGPFKLFSDDFCPHNVLVDESTLQVTAVIDWEFCYAAPAQFAGSIPWWLLLQQPHEIMNDTDYNIFLADYIPKAELFLQLLEKKEEVKGIDRESSRLSSRMQKSIDDRSAWFHYACRKVMCVDLVYWNMLDEYCWGPVSSWKERIHKITTNAVIHQDREIFVRSKIYQLREYYSELGENIEVEYKKEEYRPFIKHGELEDKQVCIKSEVTATSC